MNPFVIQHLASGGVITNYHCLSRCGHCLYNCSPRRGKGTMDGGTAERLFRRIAALGCRSVHVGGGEPLLHPDRLYPVLAAARSAGVGIAYVETNAGWFVDAEGAAAVLDGLLDAGVRTLLVSISPFHNEHIPFSRVRGLLEACRAAGMGVFPWMETFVDDLVRLDEARTHPMEAFEDAFGPNYLNRIPERYWIHWGGRALETFRPVMPTRPPAAVLEGAPADCRRPLTDTSHFHVDLHGNYIPGLCSGLAIAVEDLGRPLDPDRYPLLRLLASGGVRALYDLAAREFDYAPRREGYLNPCDICTEIRTVLWRREGERFPELAPDGFYREI